MPMKKQILSILVVFLITIIFIMLAIFNEFYMFKIWAGIFCFIDILLILSIVINTINEKKHNNLIKMWEQKGLKLEIAYNKNGFLLLLDREKGKFAVDYSENIYNISDINGFVSQRVYDKSSNKYYGHIVSLFLKVGNNIKHKNIITGFRSNIGYSNNSNEYRINEEIIREYIDLIIDLTKQNKEKFYQSNNFCPRDEIWFNGQMFSYDLASKKFCTFTEVGFVLYDFEELLDFYIEKDSKKFDKFNLKNALTGAMIGGGVGAAFWSKDNLSICSKLSLILECDLGSGFSISDNTEFTLISNQSIDENSQEYKLTMNFVDKVSRICNLILKKQK